MYEIQGLPPRLKYPTTAEKHRFTEFATRVDKILSTLPDTDGEVEDLQSFRIQYESISQALGEAGDLTFSQ